MFNELNHRQSAHSVILKYFIKLIPMHIYCLIFPIVFFALTINISFHVFDYELWEIKNLIMNSIVLILFVIPFAFLPFSLFNLTKKPVISLFKCNRRKYLKLILKIVFIFHIYYFFIFAYMLLLAVLFSINIKNNNISLINSIFKPLTKFNGTYFNNGINWISLIFSFFISFFYLLFLGYLITLIFRRKWTLILALIIFLLSMFFGGMLLPIKVLNFNDIDYQWLPFLSLFLYPITMINASWIGHNIFTFNNILGQATEYLISARILIISSSIVYSTIILSAIFYIFEINILCRNCCLIKFMYKNETKLKRIKKILDDNYQNVGFWITNRNNLKKTIKIIKKSTKNSKKSICFIDHIDSFIPELSFLENLEFLQIVYGLKYDFSQLNEIIELLNLQFIINKKTQSCKQNELYCLNIVFSLMQNPKRICLIKPSLFFSKYKVSEILNLVNIYAKNKGIELILISEDIKELQIFTKDLYSVTKKGVSSMPQL